MKWIDWGLFRGLQGTSLQSPFILGILTTAPHHLSTITFSGPHLFKKKKTRNIGWNIQLLASLKLIPKSFQNTQLRHQRIKIAPTPAAWLVPVSYEMWKFINIWWNRSPILQGQWPPAGPGPLLSEWGQHHLERRRMVSYKARTKHILNIAKTWEIASTL